MIQHDSIYLLGRFASAATAATVWCYVGRTWSVSAVCEWIVSWLGNYRLKAITTRPIVAEQEADVMFITGICPLFEDPILTPAVVVDANRFVLRYWATTCPLARSRFSADLWRPMSKMHHPAWLRWIPMWQVL